MMHSLIFLQYIHPPIRVKGGGGGGGHALILTSSLSLHIGGVCKICRTLGYLTTMWVIAVVGMFQNFQ